MEYGYLEQYYNMRDENARLISRHGSVEYLTTMRYIDKYVKPRSRILEVGAGTGRYSIALSRAGHHVTAVELLQHNIEVFKAQLNESDHIDIFQGNAMDLSRFADERFDAVLVLGPLYHLYSEGDKRAVLSEAKRMLKAGGTLFAAYCMNEATLIQFCFKGDGQNMLDCLEKHMLTADYKCISTPADVFEMVRVEDLDRLNALCGLKREKLVATDLFTQYIRERVDAWRDEVFEAYLKYHFSICERPELLGVSNHVLDILKK
ncbi:MAG: class I SAM-dependent methyltransferase [Clostridia bacterium]|nr:class I SAM-dependent methyltransferase [Clostridia bacterium]